MGLRLMRFPIHTWALEQDSIVGALRALRFASRKGPTLLHCEHGSDRTGLITALYRITYEGWTKKAALSEMMEKAYGFHPIWGNIPEYIRRVDVKQLRQAIGVS
jgi:protein tyrosine/serine phosphatase